MSDYEDETRARIIDTVIKKRNDAVANNPNAKKEKYVAHLKIKESDEKDQELKLRYIILAGRS